MMSGGMQSFTVGAGASNPGELPRSSDPVRGSGRFSAHYILLAPAGVLLDGPAVCNNSTRGNLAAGLSIDLRLGTELRLPWYPAPVEARWRASGMAAMHPAKALRGLEALGDFERIVDLVDAACRRQLSFSEFKAALDRQGLAANFRNGLVARLFAQVEPPRENGTAGNGRTRGDAVDRLLEKVNPSSGAGDAPLGGFIQAVGEQSTGHRLDEAAASAVRAELETLLSGLLQPLLSDSAAREVLVFLAALQRLCKLASDRRRQWLHLIPSRFPAAALEEHLGRYGLGAGEGRAAGIFLPYFREGAGAQAWLAAYAGLAKRLDCALCLQGSREETGPPSDALREFPRAFLFSGEVARLVELPGGDRCLGQPALLTFVEGLLREEASPESFAERPLAVGDQDVWPDAARPASTREVLPREEWDRFRESGVNRANGADGRDEVLFLPLVAVRDRP